MLSDFVLDYRHTRVMYIQCNVFTILQLFTNIFTNVYFSKQCNTYYLCIILGLVICAKLAYRFVIGLK